MSVNVGYLSIENGLGLVFFFILYRDYIKIISRLYRDDGSIKLLLVLLMKMYFMCRLDSC
jgi:hypothetical protein